MSTLIYISRNYTEFGPFTPAEILDFNKRGILVGSDHLRPHGGDIWASVEEWMAKSEIMTAKAEAKPKPVVEKKTPTAAKKAVKKAAKKAAKKATKAE
ncbi:hypothetical protein [Phragmitibacter flavus]|uniref:hypothetical protein n=1 Tax=Phragmitibacter flavus TaxID=2576071 RepID=UPI00197FC828|nr:hypothetical protein [Phragmitibacter flavus]